MRGLRAAILYVMVFSTPIWTHTAAAQDDLYFVNSGQLLRWASHVGRRDQPPQRLRLPAGLPRVGSIAVSRRNVAYVNSGLDGVIYQTDGQTITPVYDHQGQVRQLAFGPSDNILYFSVVPAAQGATSPGDGQVYALNLVSKRAELRFTVPQNAVEAGWWGAVAVDNDGRVFIGTFGGGIYELSSAGQPKLLYRAAGTQIHGLTQEVTDFYFTTGGPQVFRLRQFRDAQLAVTVPGGALEAISYAALPPSEDANTLQPCDLTITLSGDAGLVSLFSPVLRGPNVYWLSPDVSGSGGGAKGAFRYLVVKGTYWVRMDTKADTPRSPQPREQRVDCNGPRATAAFHF